MISIEDRLRAAAHAAASTVADDSAPPLQLPQDRRRLDPTRRRWALPVRRLAPIAAAAAIAAIAVTGLAVRSTVTLNDHSTARPAVFPPRYFVALTHVGRFPGTSGIRTTDAVVGVTGTGRIIARIDVPKPYNAFVSVSGAGDDRTFVLAAQRLGPSDMPQSLSGGPAARLYELRIYPGGRPHAVLTALPLPVLPHYNQFFDTIALSPDASRLAVQLSISATRHPVSALRVYDLTNGGYQTWTLPPAGESAAPGIDSPSWVAGSRFLAVMVFSGKPRICTRGCVQLLDTATPGGNVMADSRTIFRAENVRRPVSWDTVAATADGSQVLISGMAGKLLRSGVSSFYLPIVVDFSSRSGTVRWQLTGKVGKNLWPYWAGAMARYFILAHPKADQIASIGATVYGPRGRVQVALPPQTLDVAW